MQIYNIYIDETSQTKHAHLMLGGLIVPRDYTPTLENMLYMCKSHFKLTKEAKWTKVSRHHLDGYKAIVDSFFDSREYLDPVHFHSMVVPSAGRNESRYNQGSKEIGFNKEIYQLVQKFVRLYPNGIYHIYLDQRSSSQPLAETRTILNRGIHKYRNRSDWPVRRLQMRDSKDVICLQLVDVLLGGLAYQVNGHIFDANASPAKSKISHHITDRAGITDVMRDTAMSGKCTIWHRRLQKR